MWSDIKQCGAAVLTNWLEIIGGGVLAVLGFVWPLFITKLGHPDMISAPQSVIWALSAIVFLVAFFKAWRAEHRAALSATAQFNKLSQPLLSLQINQLAIGQKEAPGNDLGITLLLSVSN